ncbi:MAG: T9SS type A sorting domain-containing protein [Bacteroidota bacterium]
MARILPALLLFLTAASLGAQIELSTNYFPQLGDTLYVSTADSAWAAGLELNAAGGAELVWDFSNPVADFNASDAVEAVTSADVALFPGAQLKIRTNIFTESYYRTTPDAFELVGIRSRLDILPDFEIEAPVQPARPTRRSFLRFEDSFSTVTANVVTISPDSIPPEALALLGSSSSVINQADSVRITTTSTRSDVVDAWGTVRLGDNFYDVLREKRTESVNITVEVQRLPLPFTPVTALLEQIPQVAPFVGQQPEVTTYLFWNDDSVEPIAEVAVRADDGELIQMFYKRAQETTSVGGPGLAQARIKVYPNPATELATFEMSGLERGKYVLSLFDGLGRRVADREFSPLGDLTRLNLDVSALPQGLYLYSLRNERGRTLTTKRLHVH